MKKGLGKGLDALFTDNNIDMDAIDERQIKFIKITDIEPNKEQPRKYFDKEKLDDLARSLSEHGMLQPLIVRPIADNRYKIISGERRWRAARLAGLIEVSVLIKDIDDKTSLEIGLIENLQREDLNIIEESKGYKTLMYDFNLTQEEISKRVGKSRPVIANALRILSLPEDIISLIEKGELTSGHARALLPLMEKLDNSKLLDIAKQVINKNLTVRDLENMVKKLGEKNENPPIKKQNEIYFKEVEKDISEVWGRKVKIISSNSRNKGKIELEFYNKDDFDTLIELLKKQ